MNLIVYLSQITVIPRLITRINGSADAKALEEILGQFVQVWQGSVISVLNQFAYAILAIPSILFGYLLLKYKKSNILGSVLLILNGLFIHIL